MGGGKNLLLIRDKYFIKILVTEFKKNKNAQIHQPHFNAFENPGW